MRKIVLLFLLFVIGTIAFSQEITVRFTGQLNGTDYCRLDSVKVTNLTRNWTETVEYPDTIIVLGGTVGTNLNVAATQGLGQNIPNPFDCETRVELSVSQRENVRMQLLDASGKQYADYSGSLDAGVHTFDISAANPQTYILNALVGDKSYSIRMVNMGSGCGSSIKYAGISGSITAKLTTANEFQNGDNMRYVGYMTIYGDIVASTAVEQSQTESEDITLNFAHCINTFGTDIQSACYSYTWIDGVTYTESTTEPTFTLTNAAGCDSVVTLQLTINHSNTGIDEQTACESYIWIDGITYTESTNEPTFTLTNAVGCDSVVTLHLTINHSNTGIDEQTACDSYTWIDGVTYTTSTNEPTFTLTNVAGCDSVVTLHLTIVCPPSVHTNVATDITADGAILSGNVTSDGGATVTARGFLYGTNASYLTQTVQSGDGTGTFTKALTGLSAGTTYYYKAYATNSRGTSYGDAMQFTTLYIPTVVTYDATDITTTAATISGNITSDGGYTITAKGFQYGTSADNLANTVTLGIGAGAISTTLTSLDDNTTYFYRAYASNTIDTAYGETKTFTTAEIFAPSITTLPATDNTRTSLTLNASIASDGGAAITARGFYWGTAENDLPNYLASEQTTADFSATISDLASNTIYYFCAAATNIRGTTRGEVLSSRTNPLTAPTVVTNTATNITTETAMLNGAITDDGGTTVTARGFYWGISEDNLVNNAVYDGTANNFSVNLTGLASNTTYYYCAYATNSTSTAIGEVRSFGTPGTLNGYDWVDLGLPSGTKWATCNVGASTPEGYGDYYAWGETSPKSSYSSSNYSNSSQPTILPSNKDAATANWGSGWRMPTQTEMDELLNNSTHVWTTQNGVNGCLFTGPNGNSIFLPAAGYRSGSLYYDGSRGEYWSSSLSSYRTDYAWRLYFASGYCNVNDYPRYYGRSVRAVCQP